MTCWIIEPQDPLIVRDGRPFRATPGARARSLPFPFPSTTAGGVRTRAGKDDNGRFDKNLVAAVQNIPHRGPFLVELDGDDVDALLLPAPADALLFDTDDGVERKALQPVRPPAHAGTDLPNELTYPVGLPRIDSRKPSKRAPRFWRWKAYRAWLLSTADAPVTLAGLGHGGPKADRRLHVAIDPATQTGEDGKLFMTSGLTFWRAADDTEFRFGAAKRLALLVEAETGKMPQRTGFDPLGGERRLMHWRPTDYLLPELPKELADAIVTAGHCRIILLTPGYFAQGWLPTDLRQERHGVRPDLLAAVVGSPVVPSGWDLKKREAKPTRRLAPAGSVYYLKLTGDEAAVRAWLEEVWFRSVSDAADDQAAGFGLAAVGVWSGQAHDITIPPKEAKNAPGA